MITGAPWFVRNEELYKDLKDLYNPAVAETIQLYTRNHKNSLTIQLFNPLKSGTLWIYRYKPWL